jgi:signal peptidase I
MDKLVRGIVWVVGIALVVGVIARIVAFKSWKIPSDPRLAASIAPTLDEGDTVLVLTRGTPSFGDLVRCTDPEDPTKFVVGRIAGVDRDVVEVNGADLKVNGQRYGNESVCSDPVHKVYHPTTGSEMDITCDIVRMGGGWHYRGFSPTERAPGEVRKEVPVGQVFLVSDDRTFHDDSRDFGTLPAASCKERIVFRVTGKAGFGDDKARLTVIH